MMPKEANRVWPTPYPEVNSVLADFRSSIKAILGRRFAGMYLYGSLALGDFDPDSSDVDFLVGTDRELPANLFDALSELHKAFDEGGSPWAARVEAAYIPLAVLRGGEIPSTRYPQIEKGERLVWAPLELGWPYQLCTLREHGVKIAGPKPRDLIPPVRHDAMRQAAASIVGGWLEQARYDPGWLAWLHDTSGQAFVALTLCRLLYTLETGSVASKPQAAAWAAQGPAQRWGPLIERALVLQRRHDETSEKDVEQTLALLRFVSDRLGLAANGEA